MSKEQIVRRIQLDLKPSSIETLERLKEQMEAASYAEVFRRAMQFYDKMQTLSVEGTIIVRHQNGKEVKIILL
jgi:hypothetical protein